MSRGEIADRIAEVRAATGLSQRAIAQKIGISVRTWQEIESGKNVPSGETLLKIAELGFSPGWILTREGQMHLDSSKVSKGEQPDLDEMLMRSLAKIAIRAHHQAQIVLRNEDIAVEAATLYNELKEKADDINDPNEVNDLLPWLEGRLVRRLAKLKAAPAETTTKRA